jgi:hypothetical protein
MYKSLASLAAATMLAVFAASGPTAAAEQRQAIGAGVDQQQKAEEFTSQRRRWRRGRVIRRGGYWAPRRYYYNPRPYAYYGYPYAYGYPYRYYRRPGVTFGFGPFGFHAW